MPNKIEDALTQSRIENKQKFYSGYKSSRSASNSSNNSNDSRQSGFAPNLNKSRKSFDKLGE
jgi:hypothetical protein